MTQPDPEEREFFCQCESCEGHISYDFNDMLIPDGEDISRYCADVETLERFYDYVLHHENRRTNADFDLALFGPVEFHRRNFNADLEPTEKDFFDEMKIFKPTKVS